MTTKQQQEDHAVSRDGDNQPTTDLQVPAAPAPPSSSLGVIADSKSPNRRVYKQQHRHRIFDGTKVTPTKNNRINKPLWFDRPVSGPSLGFDKRNETRHNDSKNNTVGDTGHGHNVTQVMIDSSTSVSSSLSGSMKRLGSSISDKITAVVSHESEQRQKHQPPEQNPNSSNGPDDHASNLGEKQHRKSVDGTIITGNRNNNYNILSAMAKAKSKMSDDSCTSSCAPRSLVGSDVVASITDYHNETNNDHPNHHAITNNSNSIVVNDGVDIEMATDETSSTTSSAIDLNRRTKARSHEKKPHHIVLERSVTILVVVLLVVLGVGLTLLKSPSSSTITTAESIDDDMT